MYWAWKKDISCRYVWWVGLSNLSIPVRVLHEWVEGEVGALIDRFCLWSADSMWGRCDQTSLNMHARRQTLSTITNRYARSSRHNRSAASRLAYLCDISSCSELHWRFIWRSPKITELTQWFCLTSKLQHRLAGFLSKYFFLHRLGSGSGVEMSLKREKRAKRHQIKFWRELTLTEVIPPSIIIPKVPSNKNNHNAKLRKFWPLRIFWKIVMIPTGMCFSLGGRVGAVEKLKYIFLKIDD